MGQQALGLLHAGLGQLNRLVLLVDEVVARRLERVAILRLDVALRHRARREPRNDPIDLVVEVGRFLGGSGDDERRPRFVDKDAVHLVDDGELVPALHEMRELELHVVAQVVEPELVVRAVGDIRRVGDLPFLIVQVVLDDADRHAQEPVDAPHPLRVASRQVVVDGDDVNAFALERVEIRGKRRDERLAFTGLHFRDAARVEHHAADELHIEVPHVQHAPPRFAHHRKRLRQDVVKRFTASETGAELHGLPAKVGLAERGDARLERVDARDDRTQALQFALVLRADDFGEQVIDHAGVPKASARPDCQDASLEPRVSDDSSRAEQGTAWGQFRREDLRRPRATGIERVQCE